MGVIDQALSSSSTRIHLPQPVRPPQDGPTPRPGYEDAARALPVTSLEHYLALVAAAVSHPDKRAGSNLLLDLVLHWGWLVDETGHTYPEPPLTVPEPSQDDLDERDRRAITVLWNHVRSRHAANLLLAPLWVHLVSGIRAHWVGGDLRCDVGDNNLTDPCVLPNLHTQRLMHPHDESDIRSALFYSKGRKDPERARRHGYSSLPSKEEELAWRTQTKVGDLYGISWNTEITATGMRVPTNDHWGLLESTSEVVADPYGPNAPSVTAVGYRVHQSLLRHDDGSVQAALLDLLTGRTDAVGCSHHVICEDRDCPGLYGAATPLRPVSAETSRWYAVLGHTVAFSGR